MTLTGIVYPDVDLSYREIGRRVNCTAMAVITMYRVWTEEGGGTRKRPTGQLRRMYIPSSVKIGASDNQLYETV